MPSKEKTTLAKGTARKSKPMPEKPKSSAVEKKKKSSSSSRKPKKPSTDGKKKKKTDRMDEGLNSDDEQVEKEVVDGGEEGDDDPQEVVSDDEDNVKEKQTRATKKETLTEAERKARARIESGRRNAKAKRRGLRTISKKSGYSASVKRVGHDGAFDVAIPITTTSEAIRACKWAPKQDGKAAFEGLTEFDERLQLSYESLPKSAARVFQAHGEQYLRRLATQTVQLAADQLKTRATAAMVASVTRPLRRAQKYTFVAPKGLVRYSQGGAKGLRLAYAGGEEDTLDGDDALHKLQTRLKKNMSLKYAAEKDPAWANPSDPRFKEVSKSYSTSRDELDKIRKEAKEAGLA